MYGRLMSGTKGLTRWHRAAIAACAVAQGLAVSRLCSWLHPAWTTTLAVAAGLATVPALPARRLGGALAANLASTVAAFGLLGAAAGAYPWAGVSKLGWSWSNLALAAVWWWALHAPVVVARWRTRELSSGDAAREVVVALGASLLASATARVPTNAASARAVVACLALAVGALAWAWRKSPSAPSPEGPPERPGEGTGAPYRAVRSPIPAPQMRASWGRRALFVGMVAWGIALTRQGVWRFAHVGPERRWSAVTDAMRAVRVEDDPCGGGAGGGAPQGFVPGGAPDFESLTVWASGAIVWSRMLGDCGGTFHGRCLPPETARRWMARAVLITADDRVEPITADERAELEHLATARDEARPVTCAAGRWCSVSTAHEVRGNAGHCGDPRWTCTLRMDGEFSIEVQGGDHHHSGRIPARTARSLIAAMETAANAHGPLATYPWPAHPGSYQEELYEQGLLRHVLLVGVGPDDARRRVEFPQAYGIETLLWFRLCNALPLETGVNRAPLPMPEEP